MKRWIAAALAFVSVFTLCACGGAAVAEENSPAGGPAEAPVAASVEVVPVIPEEYRKYQELIDALEAEDYDAAAAFIDAVEPTPEPLPVEEVEITAENFPDYFEYVELPANNYWTSKDADGNVTAVYLRSGYYLRDGYAIAMERAGDCYVEAGLKYDLLWYHNNNKIKTDLENFTYTTSWKPGKRDIGHGDRMCVGSFSYGDPPVYYISVSDTSLAAGKGSSCLVPEENIQIVSVSGTLFLRGEDAAAVEKEEEPAVKVPAEVAVDVSALPEEYRRHMDAIGALEAEDYAAARNLIEELRPTPEVPPTVAVEITADNFYDYFEYVEIPKSTARVERLSSGEPAAIFAQSGFYLKDGFTPDPAHVNDSSITVDVKYTQYLLQPDSLDIDFDDLSYKLLVPLDSKHASLFEENEAQVSRYDGSKIYIGLRYSTSVLNDYVNFAPVVLGDVEIVSASGQLYLYE